MVPRVLGVAASILETLPVASLPVWSGFARRRPRERPGQAHMEVACAVRGARDGTKRRRLCPRKAEARSDAATQLPAMLWQLFSTPAHGPTTPVLLQL